MTSPEELDRACSSLASLMAAWSAGERCVHSVSVLAGSLDVCLFFEGRFDGPANCLRCASGGPSRARLGVERVQFPREAWLEGENPRTLAEHLVGARLLDAKTFDGERRFVLNFAKGSSRFTLLFECFGPQGNWFLLGDNDRVLALARRPRRPRHELATGDPYQAPAAKLGAEPPPPPSPNEVPPDPMAWFAERAKHFEALDLSVERERLEQDLRRSVARERKKRRSVVQGFEARLEASNRSPQLRREAELLLMQPDLRRRGLEEILVPDWWDDGKERRIELDPRLPLKANAERRFSKAAKLEAGIEQTRQRLQLAKEGLDTLEALAARVDATLEEEDEAEDPSTRIAALQELRKELDPLLRKPSKRPRTKAGRSKEARRPYHAFRSRSGLPILVGKGRQENDELTVRVARGNDIWLHIGEGLAGSHVVLRVERGKSAPLEDLLDAGQLALHFSKARGRPRADVIYTPAKYVRKRKGTPSGLVEVQRSKTLDIRNSEERLAELLQTGDEA